MNKKEKEIMICQNKHKSMCRCKEVRLQRQRLTLRCNRVPAFKLWVSLLRKRFCTVDFVTWYMDIALLTSQGWMKDLMSRPSTVSKIHKWKFPYLSNQEADCQTFGQGLPHFFVFKLSPEQWFLLVWAQD